MWAGSVEGAAACESSGCTDEWADNYNPMVSLGVPSSIVAVTERTEHFLGGPPASAGPDITSLRQWKGAALSFLEPKLLRGHRSAKNMCEAPRYGARFTEKVLRAPQESRGERRTEGRDADFSNQLSGLSSVGSVKSA